MFELLFNYPLTLWRQASFGFEADWPLWALALALVFAVLLILVSLQRLRLGASRRLCVAVLQTVVVAVLLTMIWQPVLQVSVSERGENTVAWLIDNSRSMALTDVTTALPIDGSPADSRLAAALQVMRSMSVEASNAFTAQVYAVGERLQSVDAVQSLSRQTLSARSNIAPALQELLATVGESALAAVVVLSDGADNSHRVDSGWWQSLAAAGVPVHTVGIGQERRLGDLELIDVSLPSSVPPDTEVIARLRIGHAGLTRARVRVSAGESLLAAENIRFDEDVDESLHTVTFASGERSVRSLEFSIEALPSEPETTTIIDVLPANNRQPRILRVVDSPGRILYVEGEPRWEYKFMRRALGSQPAVEIVSLLRTSPNKFYRQGVRDGSELADGFPRSREQLFGYEAIIIGSLEAAELSTSQQTDLRDFVSQRGGTLLMLAGRHGLADGGWGRSVVAAALPVQLGTQAVSAGFTRQRTRVMPSLTGLRTPWLHLAEGTQANLEAWQGLPEVADIQPLGQVKPGAVVLLQRDSGTSLDRRPEPVLVAQRYGRGQSLVLGTSGTWRWQMGLPSEDQRHERFWRQLLGMVVEHSLPRLQIDSTRAVYRDATSAELELQGYNADYSDLQESELPVMLTGPGGETRQVSLYPDTERPGRYRGAVTLDADGPWSVSASSPLQGESPSTSPVSVESWWVRESGNAEDFGAGLKSAFLRRISEVTGGSYLPLSEADRLSDVLSTGNVALKRESHLPLWNMPALFLLVLMLKLLEWGLRLRWKRL